VVVATLIEPHRVVPEHVNCRNELHGVMLA